MPKPAHRTTKMSVLTAGRDHIQIQVTADQRAVDNLNAAKASYESILGHPVSTSVVMRRAIDLLARYVGQVKGEAWVADELSYLCRVIR